MIYMTNRDAEIIRDWINADADVAWIVMESRSGCKYRWRAVEHISQLLEQEYAIWHRPSGPLNIPSGDVSVPDTFVTNPFGGWTQTLGSEAHTYPWFGANPAPFHLRFKQDGREAPQAIARSGFTWLANRFAAIGKPAHPDAVKWWRRLDRFIKANSTSIPWPYPNGIGKRKAYAFPDAHRLILNGYLPDANP